MFSLVQIHHGISCTDIRRTKAVLRTIGFTDHQPGAPEPLIYRNVEDDFIGQVTAPVLGDEYHTHYVENPVTGQQIDLIEIQPAGLKARDWRHPAQGDLIIGIQVEDPLDAYRAMQAADPDCVYSDPVACDEEDGLRFDWRDGQRSILTTREPFAILHYSPEDFPQARRFFEEVLDIPVAPVAGGGDQRYRLQGIDGRVDVVVTPDARRLAFAEWGKRYPGANHFRLVGRDIAAIGRGIEATGLGGYIIPPSGGFAFLRGPAGEAIETFDKAFALPQSA
jgi:hypothetical protein